MTLRPNRYGCSKQLLGRRRWIGRRRLTINRNTGNMALTTDFPTSQVVGYSLNSALGGLNAANWLSVTNNYDGNSGASFDDGNWMILTAGGGSSLEWAEFDITTGGNGGAFRHDNQSGAR